MKKKYLCWVLSLLMVTSLFPSTHSVAAYAQNNEVAATSEETDVSSTSEYEPESSDSKTDPEDVDSQSLTSSTSDVSSTSAPVSSSQEDETTAAEPDAIGLQAVAAEELTDSRAQTSTSANLGDFLTGVTINAPTDANGNYIINPGNAYDMALSFGENESIQFDDDAEMTYTLPQGVLMGDVGTTDFEINIVDQAGSATISGNTFKVVNGQLLVKFNQADPNFNRLKALANVSFHVSLSSRFDHSVEQIVFNATIIKGFVYDETSDLTITKTVTYDKNTDRANYVLKITSSGTNNSVTVQDQITGTALSFNKDVSVESSTHGVLAVTPDYASVSNGFRVSVAQMTDGEILTIRYSATIDNDKITGNGTVGQTNNKATVSSNEVPDGKETEADLSGKMNFHKIEKATAGEPASIGNNKYEVPWKIKVNKDHKLTIGGGTIGDLVRGGSQPYMQFTGDGITMEVTMENGTTETRVLSWAQLRTTSNTKGIISWEYDAPVSDGKASYEITYKTVVDKTGVPISLVVVNQAKIDDSFSVDAGTTIVGTGDKMTIDKEAVSSTAQQSEWSIKVHVIAEGYADLRVSDDLPRLQQGTTIYFDELVEGSIEVNGLLPGESYKLTKAFGASARTIYLDFYRDEAQSTTGLKPTDDGTSRDLVITFKTTVNQDWLALAAASGYTSNQRHRNYAFARSTGQLVGDSADVIPKKEAFKKELVESSSVTIDGITYPVHRYVLTLENSWEETASISDAFNTDYLKYYEAEGIRIVGETASGQTNSDGEVSAVDTSTGIGIQVSRFPKDADGKYYPVNKIYYSLIVKDEAALNALNQAALALPDGYTLENTATWGNLTSETVNVVYTYYPYVDKELLTQPTGENGYVAGFKVTINQYAQDLDPASDTLTVQDVLSPNLRFIPDSLTISPSNEAIVAQYDSATNTLTLTNVPDETKFDISYQVRVLGSGNVNYSNVVMLGNFQRTITETVNIESSGGGTGSNPSITLVKRDQEALSHTLGGATFQLYYMSGDVRVPVKDKDGQNVTFTTGADGSVLIVGNQQALGWTLWTGRKYCLVETVSPVGFELNAEPTYFILSETPASQMEYDVTGDKIDIQNARTKVSVPVIKTWVGLAGASATVHLLADGVERDSVVLSDANDWTYTFTNLDKYKDDQEIAYTVEEDALEGYVTTVSGAAATGFTITNTVAGKTSLQVAKTWVGEAADSVIIRIFADGVEVGSVVLDDANAWQHTFWDLPKYDAADGHEIAYTVAEDPVEGYDTQVTRDRNGRIADIMVFTVTNTNTEKICVPVTKTWVGPAADGVTVRLLADGEEIDSIVLSAANGWQHTFADLPRYDAADGHEIAYTVAEDPVEGYATAVSGTAQTGFSLTNTITGRVSVPVTKTWVGPAGASATVRLLADGVERDAAVLSDANAWQHTFADLDKYDGDGHEIAYTVAEDPVEGYTTKITGDMTEGYAVKNTNTATTLVEIRKQWIGKPLDAVTVKLLADGVEMMEISLKAEFEWTHTVTDLPKYDATDGHEIAYTVAEDPVEGYDAQVVGDMATGFTVTNTNTEKICVPVTKTWVGPAADGVTVRLLADGEEIDSIVLSAANGWQHTFNDLPKYNAQSGEEITYTVTEDVIEGYISVISGTAQTGFSLTNTNAERVSVPVTKQWVGRVGNPVTVRLMSGATEVASQVLSAANGWQHTFADLPRYDAADGHEIAYTIVEDPVEGYTTKITGDMATGFTVTNTLVSKGLLPRTADSQPPLPVIATLLAGTVAVSLKLRRCRRGMCKS